MPILYTPLFWVHRKTSQANMSHTQEHTSCVSSQSLSEHRPGPSPKYCPGVVPEQTACSPVGSLRGVLYSTWPGRSLQRCSGDVPEPAGGAQNPFRKSWKLPGDTLGPSSSASETLFSNVDSSEHGGAHSRDRHSGWSPRNPGMVLFWRGHI